MGDSVPKLRTLAGGEKGFTGMLKFRLRGVIGGESAEGVLDTLRVWVTVVVGRKSASTSDVFPIANGSWGGTRLS